MGVASLDLQQTDAGQGKIDYSSIINKPKINGVTLDGDLTTEDLNIVIPKLVSELQNDAGYITKNVDDLVSYYDKTEIDNMISTIPKFSIKVVDELPTEDISPTTIYLLRVEGDDHFEEWVYVDGEWDKLGDGNIDLSDYATYEYVDGKLADKADIADLSAVAFSGRYEDLTGRPVNLSQFTNDVGYLTEVPDGSVSRTKLSSTLNADLTAVENAVDGLQNSVRDLSSTKADKTTVSALSDTVALKADKSELPTKTSDLTNDSGFITSADVPTKVSELTNDSGYITSSALSPYSTTQQMNTAISNAVANKADRSEIPTKVSDLTNDSGFVNSTQVNAALAAYTYPSQDLYTQSDIDTMLAQISSLKIEVVNTLPTTGSADTIYLLKVRQQGNDIYQEYFWVNNAWELIGGIDLTDYYTKTQVNNLLTAKADVSAIPTKTSDLTNDSNFAVDANYVHTDNNYTTTEKNKLAGIAAGAEVNVQSNWTQTNSSADDFIKNKPSIPTKTSDLTNDSGFITTAAIPTNVSAFTNDAGYLDEIPDDSVGLNQLDSTIVNALNNINNKANTADLAAVAFSGDYDDLTDKPTIPTVNNATLTIKRNGTSEGTFTANASADKNVDIKVDILAITEDKVTVTTDSTKGVAPYSTSYGYTNIVADYPTPTEGSVVAFVINTKMVVASATRNVRVKFNDSDTWHPVMNASTTILAGSSYFTKAMTRLFVYKSTQQSIGALHMINDDNTTYGYLVNTIGTGFHTVETGGYMARYAISFYTQPMKTGNKVSSFVASSGTGTSKAYTSVAKYYADRGPVINYSANVAAAAATANVVYTYYQGMDLRYTANLSTTYIATNDHVFAYLKNFNTDDYSFEPSKDTKQIVSATKLATAFPSTTAGDIYLYLLGTNTSTYYTLNTPEKETSFIYKYTPSTGVLIPLGSADGGISSVAWGDITGTLSSQTDLNTALGAKANSADLATVATSGSYNDLSNKPTIPTVNNATLTIQKNSTNVATFTANAASNVTANISVPTATSDLTNDSGFLTSSTLPKATSSSLGAVQVGSGLTISSGGVLSATGGGVADSVAWGHVTGTLADQTDLNTALGAKANTADLATVATSGSYNDLSNKPTIGNATLTIQKNGTSAGTFTANATSNKSINITVPTKTSDLTNDSGFLTSYTETDPVFSASPAADITAANISSWDAKSDFSGSYNDLTDKPTIPTVGNATLTIQKNGTNVQTFTANATSNKTANITVPTKTSDLTNDSNFVADASYVHTDNNYTTTEKNKLAGIAAGAEVNVQANWTQTTTTADDYIKNKPTLATVATSGSYNDLSNKPTIPAAQVNSDWNATSGKAQILNKPTLATVATSGSYDDLSNKPTIPAAQVQSNWTQTTTTAADYIKNKPTLATVATSGSYNDLSNKPTIPTVNNATLTIQKNGTTVKTFTANASSNVTANITVPTTVAELSDASTYVTQNSLATQLANKQDTLTAGDHINITGSTIKAVDYVHSENPVSTSAVTPVVTNNMIADGTITADKLATGATVKLTLSTSDIGEGSALAANTLYGVYQ